VPAEALLLAMAVPPPDTVEDVIVVVVAPVACAQCGGVGVCVGARGGGRAGVQGYEQLQPL